MSQDYVTQLRLQLREAALREERRAPAAQRLVRARRRLPRPAPLAAALAVALLALAVAIGLLSLRGDRLPATPKVIHTFTVASGLTSVSQGFGAVWASDLSRGDVLRIDPRSQRVVARIPVGGGSGAGGAQVVVAAGAGGVWALNGDLQNGGREGPVELLRIDPRTNRIVARIPMRSPSGGNFSPVSISPEEDTVWVRGDAGALRIDPATNAVDGFVPIGSPGQGIATDGDAVWVLGTDGRLREFDARSGRAVSSVHLPISTDTRLVDGPTGLLTLIAGNRMTALERGSARALWHAAFEGPVAGWAPGGDGVLWVYVTRAPERRDLLVRVDAATGRRTGQVALPEPGAVGLVGVGPDLWVASPDGKVSVVR